MPAASKPLDPVFEIDTMSAKIRCKECFEADPIKTDWITRGAAKRHLTTGEHFSNVANNNHRHAEALVQQEHLALTYASSGYAALTSSARAPVPPFQPGLFDGNDTMPGLLPGSIDDDDTIFSPMDNLVIPAGVAPLVDDPLLEQERIRREVELLMMQAVQEDELGQYEEDDDATLTNVMANMAALGIDSGIHEDPQDHLAETLADGDYAPYPNKLTILLDILDNLPRLRMSSSQFKMILWLLKECHVKDVPSFSAFRKLQCRLRDTCGNAPKRMGVQAIVAEDDESGPGSDTESTGTGDEGLPRSQKRRRQ